MKKYSLFLIFTLYSVFSFAQIGIGTASLSYARQNASDNQSYSNYNKYPKSETLNIEDFFNYHRHLITPPVGQNVSVSIDYDNTVFNDPNYNLVQVGIATPYVSNKAEVRGGVNISLVIDISGSMSGRKIELVKNALNHLVGNLESDDILSIITFGSEAQVIFPSNKVGKRKEEIKTIINSIRVNGATNLNAGMILGYKEATKNHRNNTTSRVILLTDGETNTGETNLDNIIKNSNKYNDEGIEISTIGIGQSLDFTLLRTLADKGNGSNYYIGENEEDIIKVFDDELDSIFYKVGTNPKVEITLPSQWEIVACYGYETKAKIISSNRILFNVENLGANSTRIFLLKVKKSNNYRGEKEIVANLSYQKNGAPISIRETKLFDATLSNTNKELSKNFDIAYMATTLKLASKEAQKNITNANQSMNKVIDEMSTSSNYNDSDFQRVYKIIEQYKTTDQYSSNRPPIIY